MPNVNRLTERQLLRILHGTPVIVVGNIVAETPADPLELEDGVAYRLETDQPVYVTFSTQSNPGLVNTDDNGVYVTVDRPFTFVARAPTLYAWALAPSGAALVKLFELT